MARVTQPAEGEIPWHMWWPVKDQRGRRNKAFSAFGLGPFGDLPRAEHVPTHTVRSASSA
ncbi:uncharacterized protein QC761_0010440 [Podospora bellae-mahoneyi]|uniref:Uncharacterized protein n=1 Tax=Podospora bellae-mahoneyi TaxID=2093777 RepID=A0ABR0FYM4_9PEZI|nr:hypothetical protein QC761_0010440 [Podospora bellae-mahoneyi]